MRNKKARALVEESVERGATASNPCNSCFILPPLKMILVFFWILLLLFFPVLREQFVTFELPHGNVEQTDRVSFCVLMGDSETGRRLESSNVINLPVSMSSPLLTPPLSLFYFKKMKERKRRKKLGICFYFKKKKKFKI